jgi:folate-dependent phosphoribosylglycinamide formyltransferase PurN
MNIYVLTQEDAFYIPSLLDHLLSTRSDVVGIGIVPGELRQGHFRRYLALMGPRDFAAQAANLVAHRVLGYVGRVLPLGRSYSVADAARRHGVRCEHVAKVNDPAFIERLQHQRVELIVSVACPQVLKAEILSVPSAGAINIHGALLPDYQGLLPSFWVLAKGETETGVTVHYMDARIDQGDIILQRRVEIRPDDTVHSLVRRSKIEVGKHMLVEAIAAIDRGEVVRTPMDLSRARYFAFPDRAAVTEFRRRGRRFV